MFVILEIYPGTSKVFELYLEIANLVEDYSEQGSCQCREPIKEKLTRSLTTQEIPEQDNSIFLSFPPRDFMPIVHFPLPKCIQQLS